MTESFRSTHLDGLRGIAAVAVAQLHFFRSFHNAQLSSDNAFNYTPLSALWNGHFAVAIFFVLSGFLFFRKFHGAGAGDCALGIVKRYFRLSIPILVLSVIAFSLHWGGYMSNAEAAVKSGSDWLVKWYRFAPDLALAVEEPLYSAYFRFDAAYSYNTNLWTISYELFAVFSIIVLAWFCGRLHQGVQVGVLVAVALFSFGTHYFEFFLGALLALGLRLRPIDTALPVAVVGVLLAMTAARSFQGALPRETVVNIIYPIAGVALVAITETSAVMKRWLSSPILTWMGRISFGVYLVHFVVLSSVASAAWLLSASVAATYLVFVVATMAGAVAFFVLIDRPWLKVIDRLFNPKRQERQAAPAV